MDDKQEEKQQRPINIIVEKKVASTAPSNEEIKALLEKRQGLERSLFGINREAGKGRIRINGINPEKDTLLRLEQEFIISRKAKLDTDNTIKTYEKHFRRFFRFLGNQYLRQSGYHIVDGMKNNDDPLTIGESLPIITLEIENLAAYYQHYLSKVLELAEQTVISSLRHYRAFVYFAQDNKWIERFEVPIREVEPAIKPTFTSYEIDKLRKKPKKEDFVAYRCWVMMQYLTDTGNRISSALALKVSDIDFENNAITVNIQKNRKPKQMPLTPTLRRILREYISSYLVDDNGDILYDVNLFCNEFLQPLSYEGARDAMKDYFEDRGVIFEGFHKFRHSYAANWIRDGGNPFMLKEQLGHKSLAMTNRYANIYGMATREEAEEHSLAKKFAPTAGRRKIRMRGTKKEGDD